MRKTRVGIFILTIIIVVLGGYTATMYARGYRLDTKILRFMPSGLLVAKSDPDGASIYLNGELKGATNSNFSLTPATYDISIKKDGFKSWSKRIIIEKEVVTEINANLFKNVPSLSAITFSGCVSPVTSPDFTKIAYTIPATTENNTLDKEGLWLLDIFNLPLGFSRDPRRVTDGDLKDASWLFSPDGRALLLTTPGGMFLLDTGTFTPQSKRVNIQAKISETQKQWQQEEVNKFRSQTRGLPEDVVNVLNNKTNKVLFSPDENQILYTISQEADLSANLIKPMPGASTQPQERSLKRNRAYVYDIKEDRNFFITDINTADLENCKLMTSAIPVSCTATLSWLPTSRHLLLSQSDKIIIMDYDGTNRQEIYTGSYFAPFAFPVVSADRILILTNLGANSSAANLYSLSLK